MNKKPFKVLSTAIFFIFYSSLCLAQDNRAQINALLKNPKIIEPEIVLEDFIKEKSGYGLLLTCENPLLLKKTEISKI